MGVEGGKVAPTSRARGFANVTGRIKRLHRAFQERRDVISGQQRPLTDLL